MACPRCGAQVPPTDPTCGWCGAPQGPWYEGPGPATEPRSGDGADGRGRSSSNPVPVVVVVGIVAVIVGFVLATAVLRPRGRDSTGTGTAERFPAVSIEGAPLPVLERSGYDPAAGRPVPVVSGTTVTGRPIRLTEAGRPTMIFVIAHWCPHCNNEVPKIVEWMESGRAPDGIRFTAVSTATNPAAPHYPPAEWLEQERWPVPTLADSRSGEAARALGTPGYPYIVFVRSDGTVHARSSGEAPIPQLQRMAEGLVSASSATP